MSWIDQALDGAALSNNIEDRRNGYTENDYVRNKMKNSLLRTEAPVDRTQPMMLGPTDARDDEMIRAMMRAVLNGAR